MQPPLDPELNRREVLKGTAAVSLSVVASSLLPPAHAQDTSAPKAEPGLIRKENQKPGDRDWQLTRVRINQGKYRTSLIEGYCSHQSITAGGTLQIFVSTD